jgi:stage III sporulation protein SpoIIIAA
VNYKKYRPISFTNIKATIDRRTGRVIIALEHDGKRYTLAPKDAEHYGVALIQAAHGAHLLKELARE